jgi:hypothetical protein
LSVTFASVIKTYNRMRQILIIMTAMLMACCSKESEMTAQDTLDYKMNITIYGQTKSVTLVDNAATKTLIEKLQQGPVTVTLNSSGGFEIWGALGFSLPTSNQQITAQPGDVILYNGSNICIFYGSNSWSYTRLGKIDGLTGNELSTFLKAGQSNISVTLSLTSDVTAINDVSGVTEKTEYYSLNGQKVTMPSNGIFIRNGKKVAL